ncbi:MAG: undecaprenyldiphospho-muramoylpentapeptide beta-N-acetylglucosaminyltransferase [Gammaproteobacteria bacterium]|nr:undecaprenyldiphospho-muramoylpentapeptide beta-N-acetylglucosaminyltransferase [Gammaproteobacteria bacterium]NNK34239.1 undecaprenyldiphospho-muramoylpentapeptide beta-N-acetylglucosaminyltransferase [Xanthomonadales bacterium]
MNGRAGCVLIMAGGTGGHIFPGLAVAESLRRQGVNVHWLGARGGMECRQVPARDFPIDVVDIRGLRGKGLATWLSIPWKLSRAVAQAFRLIGKVDPSCAVSFGGYAAGPGGLAARLRGVPLLVHEQNRIPGLTNRILARFAGRVLEAFPGTWKPSRRAVSCGNPVRDSVAALQHPDTRLSDRRGPVRILLTGGSQGARALNRLLPAALALLPGGLTVDVRHQAGGRWLDETRTAYRDAGIEADVTEFIEDMAEAYGWADLVVCRAGALTVSEIAAAGIASVLVPYPHAVDDHQTENARYLEEAGAALLLPEAELTPERLAEALQPLVADRARLADMASKARGRAVPDAADRVAALCMEYLAT